MFLPLLPVFGAAAVSDIRNGRIPNTLFFYGLLSFGPGILAGTVLNGGLQVPVSHLLPSAMLSLLLPVLWRHRLLGGGDVKLFWLLFLYLPGFPGIRIFLLTFVFAFPAALYGLFSGVRLVRLGGAAFLSLLVFFGLEVGLL